MKITKFIIHSLSCAVFSTACNTVFANDIHCPPTDMIKNTVFKYAYMKDTKGDQWSLVSDHFNYRGNQFNVDLYLIDALHTTSVSVALDEGQKFFDHAALFAEPYQTKPDTDDGIHFIHCKYWEGINNYYVEATTPPYPFP